MGEDAEEPTNFPHFLPHSSSNALSLNFIHGSHTSTLHNKHIKFSNCTSTQCNDNTLLWLWTFMNIDCHISSFKSSHSHHPCGYQHCLVDVKCHGDSRWLYGPSKQSMEFDVEDDQVQCHDGWHNETNECLLSLSIFWYFHKLVGEL